MMPSEDAETKAIPVKAFKLVNPPDMAECGAFLLTIHYRGIISFYEDENGLVTWNMEINGPTQSNIPASLGDVLVWDGNLLCQMRIEEYTTKYTARN